MSVDSATILNRNPSFSHHCCRLQRTKNIAVSPDLNVYQYIMYRYRVHGYTVVIGRRFFGNVFTRIRFEFEFLSSYTSVCGRGRVSKHRGIYSPGTREKKTPLIVVWTRTERRNLQVGPNAGPTCGHTHTHLSPPSSVATTVVDRYIVDDDATSDTGRVEYHNESACGSGGGGWTRERRWIGPVPRGEQRCLTTTTTDGRTGRTNGRTDGRTDAADIEFRELPICDDGTAATAAG